VNDMLQNDSSIPRISFRDGIGIQSLQVIYDGEIIGTLRMVKNKYEVVIFRGRHTFLHLSEDALRVILTKIEELNALSKSTK
jgi:hypothetical protein